MTVKRNLILLLACLATQIAMGEPSLAEKNALGNKKSLKLLVIGSDGRELALVSKLAQRSSCLANLLQSPPGKPEEPYRNQS